jgi:hypothetical protein
MPMHVQPEIYDVEWKFTSALLIHLQYTALPA